MPYADPEVRRARQRERYALAPEKYRARKRAEYFAKYGKVLRPRVKCERPEYQKFAQSRELRFSVAKELWDRKTSCVYCGDTEPLHLDHILPKSRGGSNEASNLQWLCATCNQAKGALTTEEFMAHIRKILGRSA